MTEEPKSNVVSLFAAKEKKAEPEEEPKKEVEEASFDEVMEKNKKIKEKMEKERLAANKSVLRSYRIKN